MRFAIVDIETTGLSLAQHEIIEIACVSAEENTGGAIKELGAREWKIKPSHIHTADPVALRINHYDENIWLREGTTLSRALLELADFTKGGTFIAHNVSFDWMFLQKAFEETGVSHELHYQRLDTISIAYTKLKGNGMVAKFSLQALCEYFGIKNERAHSALADARATFELYKKLMEV